MLDARTRELEGEVLRSPALVEGWRRLAQHLERTGRPLGEGPRAAMGLTGLLEVWRWRPEDRSLVEKLEVELGLEVIRGQDRAPGRFWEGSSRCRRADDHHYDGETGLPLLYRRPVDRAVMVLVPGGSFRHRRGAAGEELWREARLQPFLIDRLPVTRRQFGQFLKEIRGWSAYTEWDRFEIEGIHDQGPWFPANEVDAAMARGYSRWVEARLPLELEWEKAARGPTGATFPWGEALPVGRTCWGKAGHGEAWWYLQTPVGRYRDGASPYGVLDLVGGLAEWCETGAGPAVPCGSSFRADEKRLTRLLPRSGELSGLTSEEIGFRLARSLTTPALASRLPEAA